MKTHTTLKRRFLSAALALIMTGSLLPAGVFTPSAHATGFTGTKTVTIDQNGGWTVTFNGANSTNASTWALAVVPDVSVGGEPSPSKHPSTAAVRNDTAMTALMGTVKATTGYYSVKGGSDFTYNSSTFTQSGSLSKTIDDALTTYATYTDASGNTKHAATDGIPFVAILYTASSPNPGVVISDTFYWKKAADGELQNGSINTNAWPAANSVTSNLGSGTALSCVDGDVTFLGYTTALSHGGGAYTPTSVTFFGKTSSGSEDTINENGSFIAGETYVITLAGTKPTVPLSGTITVKYKVASGEIKTHDIPVYVGVANQAMLVDGGVYTLSQGSSSGTWTTEPKITKVLTTLTTSTAPDPIFGSYPGYFASPITDTSTNKNWMTLTGPKNDTSMTLAATSRPTGSELKENTTPFEFAPGSGISALDPGTYTTSITYPYYFRMSDMKNPSTGVRITPWLQKYVSIPITIIVTEKTSTEIEVTYSEPSGVGITAGIDYPASGVTDWPNPASTTTPDYTTGINLPTPSADHWTFNGWKVNGSGTAYTGTKTLTQMGVTSGDSVSLVASWTYIPQYTIEYNANTGSGSGPNDQTGDYTAGMHTPALHANTFTAPIGKRFVGWCTNKDATLETVAAGTDVLYQATNTPTMGPDADLVGTAADNGDYTVTLYAIWATPPKITSATAVANSEGYKAGDQIRLASVGLSDGETVPYSTTSTDRWSHVEVTGWAMGGASDHYAAVATTGFTSTTPWTIPSTAKAGEWVWVRVKGTGPSSPVTAADIAADESWYPVAELGAAKSTLTAQVVYYDGTNYSTTKPSSVGSVVPKINGQNTYTDNYTLDLNGNITLTTTYTGDKLTFVGWSTTQNVTTTDNCSGVSAPSGMTHSGAHKIIKTDMSQPTITAIMDQGTKSGGTVALPIPTTIYAIYRVKQSAALTVKFAKSNGASTPTYTAWDGDADGDSTADAKYGVQRNNNRNVRRSRGPYHRLHRHHPVRL